MYISNENYIKEEIDNIIKNDCVLDNLSYKVVFVSYMKND